MGAQRDGDLYAPNWERWARQEEEMLARERTPERADVSGVMLNASYRPR